MQANEAEICFEAPKSKKHLGLSVRKHQLHVPEARNSCVCMMSCEVDSSSADRKHEASSLHTAQAFPGECVCKHSVHGKGRGQVAALVLTTKSGGPSLRHCVRTLEK